MRYNQSISSINDCRGEVVDCRGEAPPKCGTRSAPNRCRRAARLARNHVNSRANEDKAWHSRREEGLGGIWLPEKWWFQCQV